MSISFLVAVPGSGVCIVCRLLFLFSVPSLAASAAASFPAVPMWALIQAIVRPFTLHFRFSRASAVLSAIVDLKSIPSSVFSAAC